MRFPPDLSAHERRPKGSIERERTVQFVST
jgi:hypothetical protein